MNNENLINAVIGIVDVVVENQGHPLTFGDIKFEIGRTGVLKSTPKVSELVVGDAIHILEDLKVHLGEKLHVE